MQSLIAVTMLVAVATVSGQGLGNFDIGSILGGLDFGNLLGGFGGLGGGNDPVKCFEKMPLDSVNSNAIKSITRLINSQKRKCNSIKGRNKDSYTRNGKDSLRECQYHTEINLCEYIDQNSKALGCNACQLSSSAVLFKDHTDCVCKESNIRARQTDLKGFLRAKMMTCLRQHDNQGQTKAELNSKYPADQDAIADLKCKR